MILREIKEYLLGRRAASLSDLSTHFRMEPLAMRGMLEQWVRKGKLRRLPGERPCKGCCGECRPEHMEVYQWIG